MTAPITAPARFGTATLAPGAYRAALIDGEGKVEATAPFWLLARDAQPQITVSGGPSYTIDWQNGPANRLDWVGIYPAGEVDLYNYIGFTYTGARSTGSMLVDASELGLTPGKYEARLMLDDGYSILAQTEFEIAQ